MRIKVTSLPLFISNTIFLISHLIGATVVVVLDGGAVVNELLDQFVTFGRHLGFIRLYNWWVFILFKKHLTPQVSSVKSASELIKCFAMMGAFQCRKKKIK